MNILEMAKSYIEAKFGGDSLPEDALNRLITCMGCEYRVEKEGLYYCKECGCPQTKYWPDSELRRKVTFAQAKCVKNKWQK